MTGVGDRQTVSVIIPVLNGATRISRAIESALSQEGVDVEIVVVDDGSTDDLDGALAPHRSQLTLVRHDRPRGASASRNDGFARAHGSVIAYLDHDDWWPSDLLTLAARVAPGQAVCYDLYRMAEAPDGSLKADVHPTEFGKADGVPPFIEGGDLEPLADGAPILKSLVHRDDVERVAGYDVRFYGVEDYHFHVKLVAAGVRLELASEPKGFYRVHQDSTTSGIADTRRRLDNHVKATATWAAMYRVMPRELTMSASFARNCHRKRQYWAMRHWKAVLTRASRTRSLRGLGDRALIAEMPPALIGAWRALRSRSAGVDGRRASL